MPSSSRYNVKIRRCVTVSGILVKLVRRSQGRFSCTNTHLTVLLGWTAASSIVSVELRFTAVAEIAIITTADTTPGETYAEEQNFYIAAFIR